MIIRALKYFGFIFYPILNFISNLIWFQFDDEFDDLRLKIKIWILKIIFFL